MIRFRRTSKKDRATLSDLYSNNIGFFISYASQHIFNRDRAIDAVHDAFVLAQEWVNKKRGRWASTELIKWMILKTCKKINMMGREVPLNDEERMPLESGYRVCPQNDPESHLGENDKWN